MSELTRSQSFFIRHEFAIRRLHSLLGIVPLGLYMCIHLTTNASLLNGTETFQRAVYYIHSLGAALPLVEWGGIFLPLLFHAILGVWIIKTGKSNLGSYKFTGNKRYTWQRWTGLIAFVFLMLHVLHLHGWFHFGPWLAVMKPLGFANFYPYNAASSLAMAMDDWAWGLFWPAFYLIGVWATVFHLANGLWTAGITWGLWISPSAQERATKVCVAFGVLLTVIGTAAWWAAVAPGPEEIAQARETENEMYEAALKTGLVYDMPEKRYEGEEAIADEEESGEIDAIIIEETVIIETEGTDAGADETDSGGDDSDETADADSDE
ncbi:succinate dehydrogenase cytochrome b558 subunit [Rhodopirellula sallentina]|uniref:Succinate dehydrogenase (Or fumarate reductase) cytochrome b subunit, b558 family n=1 Tax=Rhodopirellula sallentina SM41 TaxID=1263870 RepID=M5UAL5_9BACT|nr:succinate dehydrogenase cytochrome b558 subunit [Rhodopirellula sallentina]EMI53048.1 succinate dehydrogenase (or fumarate reductase) cytochrome b subunit, b558 family [Rhodopirellula sallentina SM41]